MMASGMKMQSSQLNGFQHSKKKKARFQPCLFLKEGEILSGTNVKVIRIDGQEHFATKEELQEMKNGEITVEELLAWYEGVEVDTGLPNYEIDEMYEKEIRYESDTGLPNYEIDEMYKM